MYHVYLSTFVEETMTRSKCVQHRQKLLPISTGRDEMNKKNADAFYCSNENERQNFFQNFFHFRNPVLTRIFTFPIKCSFNERNFGQRRRSTFSSKNETSREGGEVPRVVASSFLPHACNFNSLRSNDDFQALKES